MPDLEKRVKQLESESTGLKEYVHALTEKNELHAKELRDLAKMYWSISEANEITIEKLKAALAEIRDISMKARRKDTLEAYTHAFEECVLISDRGLRL